MRKPGSPIAAFALGFALAMPSIRAAYAQGVTTGAVSGVVSADDGGKVDDAEVEAVNNATGFTARAMTRHGRFLIQALEVGGPYTVIVRRLGFRAQRRDGLYLTIGKTITLDLQLERAAAELSEVTVTASHSSSAALLQGGVGSIISDSLLHRLPTENRDLYAFVQLSPQVSSRFGVEGGGVNARYNHFVIDGATEQALHGRNAAGGAIGKTVSIEAVKEYQVVLTSYDVALGDFAGALVNAVTKGGTNELHGSAFSYLRNEQLARDVPLLRDSPYERAQYGFVLGGPIVHDRMHFFIASELQHYSSPAPGPYVGQSASSATPVPASIADIDRFRQILDGKGLEAGTAGPVSNTNPLLNLFVRFDLSLPRWNSRLVIRDNYSHGAESFFERVGDGALFRLSSSYWEQTGTSNVPTLLLYTGLRNGGSNELIASYYDGPFQPRPRVIEPLVRARVPLATGAGTATLEAGPPDAAQGFIQQRSLEVTDNLRVPIGAQHLLTFGGTVERFLLRRRGIPEVYGLWEFASLDSLASGTASRFRIGRDFGGGDAQMTGRQLGVYAGDRWQLGDRFAMTAGVRAEAPVIDGHPPYSSAVDSTFARRTDVMPESKLLLAPRFGFEWDVTGDARNRVRGGLGIFVGRPPLSWWLNALAFYGEGVRELRCGSSPADAGLPPPFDPDARNPPAACANGVGFNVSGGGAVNLLDRHLSFPRTLRASLGYDRQLPWGTVASIEGLYTAGVTDFLFVNRALRGPVGADRHGRLLYGSFNSFGFALPDLVSSAFPDVIDLVNQSRNRSWNLSVQLSRRFSNRFEATLAYTHSRSRDVQTIFSASAEDNAFAGPITSGRVDAPRLALSDIDQPHRVVAAATWTAPWHNWETAFSLYYVGSSGTPFTYTAAEDERTGDLNADGTNLDDAIYVPRNAADTSEMRFDGGAKAIDTQAQALNAFVERTPCLARQRGRIMQRNSCRTPWMHTLNLAVRQGVPGPWGRSLSVELQLFNVLNILDDHWGLVREPNTALLRHTGQTSGPPSLSQPIFRFDPKYAPYSISDPASYYQLQLGVRYSI